MGKVGIQMPTFPLGGGLMFVDQLREPVASCFINKHISQKR